MVDKLEFEIVCGAEAVLACACCCYGTTYKGSK